MLVFDRFVIILAVLGVVSIFFDPHHGWLSHVIGGVVGFAVLYGVQALFYYGFKKDALGGGDIKLTGAVGLLLGWERLLLAILIASLSASVILLIANRRKSAIDAPTEPIESLDEPEPARSLDETELIESLTANEQIDSATFPEVQETAAEASEKEYPFAPFLCTGFWVALMFGAQIIQAYLSLFGM